MVSYRIQISHTNVFPFMFFIFAQFFVLLCVALPPIGAAEAASTTAILDGSYAHILPSLSLFVQFVFSFGKKGEKNVKCLHALQIAEIFISFAEQKFTHIHTYQHCITTRMFLGSCMDAVYFLFFLVRW